MGQIEGVSNRGNPAVATWWETYRTLIVVTFQLALAQLAPFLLAFAVNRAALKAGNAAYESFALTDRFNLTLMVAAVGFLQAMYFLAGRELANPDSNGYHRAFKSGLIATVLISIVLILISLSVEFLLGAFGVEASLLPFAGRVGKVAAIGIFPAVLLTLLRVHFVMRGKAWLMTIIYIAGAAVGITFVHTMTSGDNPSALVPAWAVVVANSTTVLLAFVFERLLPELRVKWLVKSSVFETWQVLWSVGWPIGTVVLLESISMLLSTLLLGQWWHSFLSVHSIVLLWLAIVQVVPLGLSQIASKQIAVLSAQGNHSELGRTAKAALALGLAYAALTVALFNFFPVQLGEFFTGPLANGSPMATGFALLFPLGGILSAAQTMILVGAALLRGLGQTRAPLFQALVGYGLLAGVTQVLFAKGMDAGPQGLWWGMIFGFICTAAALLLKVRKEFRSVSTSFHLQSDFP